MDKIAELIAQHENYAFITQGRKSRFITGESIILPNNSLQDIEDAQKQTGREIAFILPFCTARREGIGEAHGDEPILAFQVEDETLFKRDALLDILPDIEISHDEVDTTLSDEEYKEKVEDIKREIENGTMCQTVLSRAFETKLQDATDESYLSLYKRLLKIPGGYMTYMMQFGNKLFAGASPEVHLRVKDRSVYKAPLAGTVPKGQDSELFDTLIKFLSDKKEKDELAMITDEELKMLVAICKSGRISGPYLKEIGKVIHTEHRFMGELADDYTPIDALRRTLFSPTIVGGPIESAFAQICKYEDTSRGYYGTAVGVYSQGHLDTAIPIRSVQIQKDTSKLSVRAGAGIVQGSVPQSEADETRKKARGFLGILQDDSGIYEKQLSTLSEQEREEIQRLLRERQEGLSKFYFEDQKESQLQVEELLGKSICVIHNGDDFTAMIQHMLESMGMNVGIIKNTGSKLEIPKTDIVLLGPGYGDINDSSDKKMKELLRITDILQDSNTPLVGICLGHQAICKDRGLQVCKQETTSQGEQKELLIDDRTEQLGFYNSYSPVGDKHDFDDSVIDEGSRVMYQKNKNTVSCQFHPESIMSTGGSGILKKMLLSVV